ncbi:MAG: response regulator [Gammaproteobacteria bacterium]|nr:response regulator [Gammaproteobacteria bacterium]
MTTARINGTGTPAILVVEDDPVVRTRVITSLRQNGFETASALTREEIFALVDDKRCAALVLDLGLPNDDGVAIARAVRQRSEVPIVMLTGRGRGAGLKKLLEENLPGVEGVRRLFLGSLGHECRIFSGNRALQRRKLDRIAIETRFATDH